MENKKDIGKAFREKLDRLDRTAPNSGWNAISGELQQMNFQRRFPWRKISGLALLVLLLALVATYPYWKDDVPTIYMEMPTGGQQNEEAGHSEPQTGKMHDTPEAMAKPVLEVPDKIKPPASRPSAPGSANINAMPAPATDGPPVPHHAKTIGTENTSSTKEAAQSAMPATQIPVQSKAGTNTTPAAASDDGEGKFKMLDLRNITYGADTLKAKKEKRLDTKRISDSLNKLYGRERPARKNKKNE